jgi:hypothetical protein
MQALFTLTTPNGALVEISVSASTLEGIADTIEEQKRLLAGVSVEVFDLGTGEIVEIPTPRFEALLGSLSYQDEFGVHGGDLYALGLIQ